MAASDLSRRAFLRSSLLLVALAPRPGRAQPPTSPASPLGLGQLTAIQCYLERVRKFLRDEWPRKSAKERARGLVAAVHPELEQLGVPAFNVAIMPLLAPLSAQFDSEKWELHLGPELLTADANSAAVVEGVALVYHEACHAEEYWIIACWIAGMLDKARRTDEELRKRFRIAAKATRLAVQSPLPKTSPLAPAARAWFSNKKLTYDVNWNAFSAAHAAVAEARAALSAAPEAGTSDAGETLTARRLREADAMYRQAESRYRDQPLEAVAYAASDEVRRLLLAGR